MCQPCSGAAPSPPGPWFRGKVRWPHGCWPRSPRAESKALSKKTSDGEPVHSFKTLLRDLATVVKNRVQPKAEGTEPFDITTTPTSHQKRVIDLLKIRL